MSAEWDDLARLAEAATAGEWTVRAFNGRCYVMGPQHSVAATTGALYGDDGDAPVLADAEFIAAANPATILRLISERDTLAKAVQLTAEAATARLAEVEAERDVLAARLAAVEEAGR